METNFKRIWGVGTAIAALFIGASLNATPASALTPAAHSDRLTTAIFAHGNSGSRGRNPANFGRHDNGKHKGWSKQQEKQYKQREKWERQQAKRHGYANDGDYDQDDNYDNRDGGNYRTGQDHNWNGTRNGDSNRDRLPNIPIRIPGLPRF